MNEKELQNNIESLKSSYENISLSSEEKSFIKESILSDIDKRIASQKVPSPFWYFKNVGVAFLMFILIGAPISFAAENSLPGDILYSVKTDFNESVAEIITPEEKKSDFYQSIIEKRVEEIKKVSEKEEITTEDVEDFKEVLFDDVEKAINFSQDSNKLKDSEEDKKEIAEDRAAVVASLEEVSDFVDKIVDEDKEDEDNKEVVEIAFTSTTTIDINLEDEENVAVKEKQPKKEDEIEVPTTEEILDDLIEEVEDKIEEISESMDNQENEEVSDLD